MEKEVKNHLQGNILVPDGMKIIEKDGWLIVSESKKSIENIKESCYFCGFNKIIQSHHIIRKCDGGDNKEDNLIILCPNHHELIHKFKYSLGIVKGIYYLKDTITNEVIPPNDIELKSKRKIPSCIKGNKNLIIQGDLNKKATISLRFIQRKKNKVGVCNETSVQSQ